MIISKALRSRRALVSTTSKAGPFNSVIKHPGSFPGNITSRSGRSAGRLSDHPVLLDASGGADLLRQ